MRNTTQTVEFVDVPGHERYVHTMAAGAHGAAGCLFVVSGVSGWQAQSAEHLAILELLGMRYGVVAVTMLDKVDADQVDMVSALIRAELEGSFLAAAEIVPVSAVTGQGLSTLSAALFAMSMAASTLHQPDRRSRLWIDRSFTVRGAGTIVTGTLTGWKLRRRDHVDVAPRGTSHRIRAIQLHGSDREEAEPGHRVALNLVDLAPKAVGRGNVVVFQEAWHLSRRFDVALQVIATATRPLTSRGAHLVSLGTGEWATRLQLVRLARIEPGGSGYARLNLPVSLPVRLGDPFIVRDANSRRVVAGGVVLDVDPVTRPSRARPPSSTAEIIDERGWITERDFFKLTGQQRQPDVSHWIVAPRALEDSILRIAERVEAHAPLPLGLATFDERDQALIRSGRVPSVKLDQGIVRSRDAHSAVAQQWIAGLEQDCLARKPDPGITPIELRDLTQRECIVMADGIACATAWVDKAIPVATALAAAQGSFSIAEFRDAMATTRATALLLLMALDKRGITQRQGPQRVVMNTAR